MKPVIAFALALLLWPLLASAQQLPALTGRVVDSAELLEPPTEARLTQMLAAHEGATGEQLVVVTVPDLQGGSIEEFGIALGREWGIGQEGEDNGALLIVARDDRRVRIEVGYGLEGRLTDAQASVIINRIIVPAFQQGEFERGIVEATEAMIQVLGGEPLAGPGMQPVMPMRGEQPAAWPALLLLVMIVLSFLSFGGRGGGRRGGVGRAALMGAMLGGMGRGMGGGGFGGGGFGGGGGGFGGGGASGGW
ncbi:TPM domain-containing protein [Stutzerimonas tarimensis]|uniref:TPM domain-containing protein n=1 Tax=Stutzerimonas tarimensis TaxID=1507735 RepID=A0ABV7T3C6_9GAMM